MMFVVDAIALLAVFFYDDRIILRRCREEVVVMPPKRQVQKADGRKEWERFLRRGRRPMPFELRDVINFYPEPEDDVDDMDRRRS